VYLGSLIKLQQTSWVGTILLIFTSIVTIGVAAYLYRSFREFKQRHDRLPIVTLEESEEFEIDESPSRRKSTDRGRLVTRRSDDDFFFDEEEEIGR